MAIGSLGRTARPVSYGAPGWACIFCPGGWPHYAPATSSTPDERSANASPERKLIGNMRAIRWRTPLFRARIKTNEPHRADIFLQEIQTPFTHGASTSIAQKVFGDTVELRRFFHNQRVAHIANPVWSKHPRDVAARGP